MTAHTLIKTTGSLKVCSPLFTGIHRVHVCTMHMFSSFKCHEISDASQLDKEREVNKDRADDQKRGKDRYRWREAG